MEHGVWTYVGFPTVGFWADKGGEFKNYKMEEFTNMLFSRENLVLLFYPGLMILMKETT